MEGPSATVALVLAETVAGGAALLWLGRLWGRVKRGFFVLTEAVVLGCALLSTLAASASVEPGDDGARFGVLLLAACSVLLALSLAALVLRIDGPALVSGSLAVPVAAGALAAFATTSGSSFGPAVLQLAAGAAFMGAVTDGLLLGHWYLVDRRLAHDHIRRFAGLLIGAVILEAAAVALLVLPASGGELAAGFNPLLGISGLPAWLALGMVACTALIAFLIRATLKDARPRSVQAATGFFYLAVITAFTAELAAKVGFSA
ncbi:MAG TPA: hypothetical protein VG602_02480 [Actinomycetota bacterium]|nr:hypothetical protein [Actinomycetota bacterium]